VHGGRIFDGAEILTQRSRIEPFSPAPKVELIRISRDHQFGERLRLGQEQPVPVLHRQGAVHLVPHLNGRDDVQDGELFHATGVIKRHPIGGAGPSVIPRDVEPLESERLHHGNLVPGHRPLRVRLVVWR
jgi:hypothetical protein